MVYEDSDKNRQQCIETAVHNDSSGTVLWSVLETVTLQVSGIMRRGERRDRGQGGIRESKRMTGEYGP